VEAGLRSVEVSSGLAGDVEATLGTARDTVERAGQGVEDIALTVREQKTASTLIAQHTERISQSAEETSNVSRQMHEAAAQLRDAADGLNRSVSDFRV
jgi:methyl-accepting chemotaxis protein